MTLDEWNKLPVEMAVNTLRKCCGSTRWIEEMIRYRPFATLEALLATADKLWWQLQPEDWQEAFSHHPRIGDVESLEKKFAATAHWTTREQSGALGAPSSVLAQLAEGNRLYEEKFGYIFIVFATGKSAEEMLHLLQQRLANTQAQELPVAAAEQAKITRLRILKLFNP
jgi:2-oxo-4-hydroxy-4-carboxy-5-ureidoimidazoline decarboxylase